MEGWKEVVKHIPCRRNRMSEKCGWGDNRFGQPEHCWRAGKGVRRQCVDLIWLLSCRPVWEVLKTMPRGLPQPIVGSMMLLKKFKWEVESLWTFSPSFQPPTRGFIDTCFYIIPSPLQTSCNSFPCRTSVVTKMIQTSDSRIGYKILVCYMLSLLQFSYYLLSLTSFCPDLYTLK